MSDETIIIGGGPAGSAAAIALARFGMPVRLVERQSDPHHKVCGEFISYEAAHHLANLGLDVAALGAEPIRHARFFSGEDELTFDLPFTAWSLSRCVLDSALLKAAKAAGANVQLGTAVRQLARTDDAWELVTLKKSSPANASTAVTAKTIFLANGKHELRNWQRNARSNGNLRAAPNNLIGLKMHFSPGTSPQINLQETVEIHLFDGGYAGLEPIENGAINLCFLIKQDIYKACDGSWPAVLDWLGRTSSHMRDRLATLTPLWAEPLAVAGVPYGYIASPADAVDNLFRLGDQAAVIPSFAGDGIAIALHTASLAAQVHASGGNSAMYQQQAAKDLTRPVRDARRFAELLAHRAGRKAAFTLAARCPRFLREKLFQTLTMRTRVGLPFDRPARQKPHAINTA